MILGRTPAGAIKIKTDSPLGLRAVECACCNTCPCGVTIPQALRELVANATIDTITMFGLPPIYFYPAGENPFWQAGWGYDGFSTPILLNAEIFYYPETGCLYTSGFYTEWNGAGLQPSPNPPFGSILGLQAFGDGQLCEPPEFQTTANGTFTINGEGAYKYYYFTGIDPNTELDYLAVPPPNFVFT
jgi:hypothetical protein